MSSSETVLQEAERIVNGQRNIDYGKPENNFAFISDLWSAYLNRKYGLLLELHPEDVGFMMILLKVARNANAPKRDNLVDIAGYAACIEKLYPSDTFKVSAPNAQSTPPADCQCAACLGVIYF